MYLVWRLKFIAPPESCLIEGGWSRHPFINLLKSRKTDINFYALLENLLEFIKYDLKTELVTEE